ncbi:hypothetical protein B9Z55_017978 [Caenorhabditis nigoni]|uniref:Peptidase C1A papain C-terminal domain-containing protein n=1 Tax=Caenorhabditis nigoni TaxID=1611254 RepID=A0A2G5TCL5_9PELO|nr:hypothetical protein B9Z55_017978 [Caenorhabditis nigoni]
MKCLLLFFACCSTTVLASNLHQLLDFHEISHINSIQNSWTAGPSKLAFGKFQRRLMRSEHVKPHKSKDILDRKVLETIPESYDVRDYWSQCISIDNIRDQSDCGSCWAVAAAETISDRLCIASNGSINTFVSAEDLLSCCTSCGDGCDGGYPLQAWRYWVKQGLVSGGSYESQYGCKPYSIAPCGQTVNGVTWPKCPAQEEATPECVSHCTSKNPYSSAYEKDKHYGLSAYPVGRKEAQIQSEILQHGPVEAGFLVYSDFYRYKSGIYTHVSGQELGGHAVKVLGWGVENGTKYWLVANSWNINWGEKGYFRILRGRNECGIESAVVAGIPDLTRNY